jgi:bacterioferritin-associated ferredoxin
LTPDEFETNFQIQKHMIVCLCRAVCDRTIRTAIDAGARSVDEVAAACRAGSGCGACHETIESMICEPDEAQHCPRRSLKVVSSPYLALARKSA